MLALKNSCLQFHFVRYLKAKIVPGGLKTPLVKGKLFLGSDNGLSEFFGVFWCRGKTSPAFH